MMFRTFERRKPLALILAMVVSMAYAGAGAPVASAAGGVAPFWGNVSTMGAPGSGLLAGVDCMSSDTCLAVGETIISSSPADELPAVIAETGGKWGTAQVVAMTGVSKTDGGYLSVSCMNASSCVGVGYNSDSGYEPLAGPIAVSGSAVTANPAAVLSLPSAPMPASTEDAALASVSCTSTTCTAVGFYETSGSKMQPMVATMNAGGLWVTAAVAPPAAATGGANLTAVSCPASGACEAVGNYLNGSNIDSWSVQLGGGTPQTLTLPSGATNSPDSLPPVPELLNEQGDEVMSAISCPTASSCTALGQYPVSGGSVESAAFGISNGAQVNVVALPSQSGLAYTEFDAVWCSDATDCAAEGTVETEGSGSSVVFTPVTSYEAGGTWAPFTTMPGGAPSAAGENIAIGLGCSSVDSCLGVGLQVTGGTLNLLTPMVDFSAPLLSVTTTALPAATGGAAYNTTLQGTGGNGASSWSVTGTLPAGLSLDSVTGVISGTPVVPGTYSFTVHLANAGPPSQSASVSLSITVAAAPTPAAVPKVSTGAPKVTATGLTLPLGCAGSGTCSGTAVVTAMEHFRGRKLTGVTAHVKKRTVKLTLAAGSYSLSAGQLGSIKLKLTAQAMALLKKLHKLSGTLTVTPTGASQPAFTRTVTFKSAIKKRKKKH